MLEFIVPALQNLLTIENLIWINLGVFFGSVFAAIPGLTVILCIILFLPFTYQMTAIPGMMFLLGIYCAGGYGGSWAEQHKSSSNWYNRSRQTEENVIRDSDRFSYVRDEDDGWSGSVWRAKQKARNAASATPVGSRVFHETFG